MTHCRTGPRVEGQMVAMMGGQHSYKEKIRKKKGEGKQCLGLQSDSPDIPKGAAALCRQLRQSERWSHC